MKYYSGMVIHSDDQSLYEAMTDKGMRLEEETAYGDAAWRQVGHYWDNPLQVVSDWVLENNKTLSVTLEETVDGDEGSLGDIFTIFTYENGYCVNVETEWVTC